jgi:tripartite-type tricarboxylate transporter receptor subunit TctC
MKKGYSLMVLFLMMLFTMGPWGDGVNAQDKYPSKPIKVVVVFPAGGGTDLFVRAVQEKAEQILGQRLILEYKHGLSGAVGIAHVKDQKPDGYTIAAYVNTGISITPHFVKVPYNALEDFTFINLLVWAPHAITCSMNAPWNTIDEFVKYARGVKEGVNYCTPGVGGSPHLSMALLAREAKIKLNHVPMAGGAGATTALLGGHMQIGVISNQDEYVRAKRLKLLAYVCQERSKAFPQVPSLKEAGYDVNVRVWYGLLGPKGMPKEIVETLDKAFYQPLLDKAIVQKLETQVGVTPTHVKGEELVDLVTKEFKGNGETIRSLGLKIELEKKFEKEAEEKFKKK